MTITSKFYPIEDDWRQLSASQKDNIHSGIVIAEEQVIKFYNTDEIADILLQCAEDLKKNGNFFIPQFETKNFVQGFAYRPTNGSLIDKLYNRDFYKDHWAALFKNGFDPVLSSVCDILIDERNNITVSWDSRHRMVGYLSAKEGNQVPENQWCNVIKIKDSAPKEIRPEKVACVYFKNKNETPKALSPEEKFVAEYRAEDAQTIRAYMALQFAGLRLDCDKLPELSQSHKDSRIITGIAKFKEDFEKESVGKGLFLSKAVDSMRKVWSYAQNNKFSVYFILAYCYLLKLSDTFNGDFGYDNKIMIQSLCWAYNQNAFTPKNYCSPRASGKAIESVAFHLGRIYNTYIEKNEIDATLLDLNSYIGLPKDFLVQIGIDVEEEEEHMTSLEEAFNL
jgi:hypothetical protein